MDRNVAIKKKAQQLIQKGQIDAALAEFDKLFAQGDKDPYDFILVADLLAKRGSMQEAVRRYRQAVEEYTRAELFKNAIAVCKKILRISKEDLQIHRTLGELYAKEGLYGDAIIHYLEFAEGSIRRQDHEAALDVIETVLGLSPENDELSEKFVEIAVRADQPERGGKELYRRADRLARGGRSAEAAELRERASTLAPGAAPEPAAADDGPPSLADGSFSATPAAAAPAEPSRPAAPEAPSQPAFGSAGFDLDQVARAGEGEDARVPEPGVVSLHREEPPLPPAADKADAVGTHAELAAGYLSAGNRELAAEEFWKAAELAFFRGDLTKVRTLLTSLLTAIPNHEAALRRLVDITSQAEDRPAEAKARFDLAEVYLAHEEWPLARAEYMRVLELNPGNDRARARVQRLDAMNGDAPAGIDLDAIDTPKPAASVRVRDEQPASMDNLVDLEEIIDEFKAGVSNTISGEDHESHYDLGMAYMEMGLHDEAIQEFQIASKGGPMELKCLEMIALCYLEKNEPAAAARELDRALQLPGHGPEETISIRYNLGLANERLGNLDKALQHFEEVYLLNVDFLKVAAKVREVKARLAGAQDPT
ncbi:MAG TPA: tetratricopeptide repeat protein [Candidatus Omnitrophota bacterium]|nr:tetratricopeptide repeat protein [Candidatus Omnitrophota bacterium]